ncbi:hypothetical protein PENARI_c019G05424 [Penicillium arizonense]|uniref:Uncharacterized protein n=1 Tax=Penicillium arizonense TaxID=1835702 RepID=A0A1F5L9S6_PENAI|nr:hypothetical protein PENARI_c019G05424 [Penicillium arizonense]OGE49955.1 hypothetical protein PENARI_c019G05424 [Penicillium arizonense]
MSEQPRRSRRSSITGHLNRVFNKSQEKRYSSHGDLVSPAARREAFAHNKAASDHSWTRRSLKDETGPSSVSYSSMHSRLPSTGTPGSSPSVAPVGVPEDDTPTQPMTPLAINNPNDGAKICKSPTWDTSKKEKRVTRRLEAERKELEKRLQALEEAQLNADHGIYDRNSRRLTKKQPVSTSSRSSSANRERPRSSSGFSSLFRRSRSNSNASDADFQSADASQLRTDTSPPSLPLTLPERFGTAITRELASKHGTSLNLSTNQQKQNPTNSTNSMQRRLALHSAAKSDDLRESWKMAEAWKTKNDENVPNPLMPEQTQGNVSGLPKSPHGAQGSETNTLPRDLDREQFSAVLKHDRKSVPVTDYSLERLTRNDGSYRATTMPTSKTSTQADLLQHGLPTLKVSTARQLQAIPPPETLEYASSSPAASTYHPLQLAHANSTGDLVKPGRLEPNSHTQPKIYKSSPLALNPANTDDVAQRNSRIPKASTMPSLHANASQLARHPLQPDDNRGRSRLPTSSGPIQQSRFKENFHEGPDSPEPPQIPIKSERRSQDSWRQSTASTDNVLPHTPRDDPAPFKVAVRSPFHTGNSSPDEQSHPSTNKENRRTSTNLADGSYSVPARSPRRTSYNSNDTSGNQDKRRGPGGFFPGHNRTPSYTSSHDEHSNYDTADEDTPESPELHLNSLTRVETKPEATAEATTQDLPASRMPQPGSQPDTPPLRNGPISILKRRSQKNKSPRKPQTIAKIFVICCRCKYWQDMPSEVYARLACPERLGTESKLGRSHSKKSNVLIPDHTGSRRLSGSRQFGNLSISRSSQGMSDLRPAPLLPHKVTCCWCGHNMSRSCCEGWTTVVEMRERHH